MRKGIYLFLFLLIPTLVFSQKTKIHSRMNVNHSKMNHHSTDTSDSTTTGQLNFYIAASFAASNGDTLSRVSYPSIESGIRYENLTLGINAGRNNMVFKEKDNSSNYYWELKSTVSTKLGIAQGYLLFGYGHYLGSVHNLIEFGSGITLSHKNTDYYLQISNFDRIDYMSVGIAYNF